MPWGPKYRGPFGLARKGIEVMAHPIYFPIFIGSATAFLLALTVPVTEQAAYDSGFSNYREIRALEKVRLGTYHNGVFK